MISVATNSTGQNTYCLGFDDIDDYDAVRLQMSYCIDAPADIPSGSTFGYDYDNVRYSMQSSEWRDGRYATLKPAPAPALAPAPAPAPALAPARVEPLRTTRTKLHPLESAVGEVICRAELRSSRGGSRYYYPAKIWVRGYDALGRKCYEELYTPRVDQRSTGPRSLCGILLANAELYAAALNKNPSLARQRTYLDRYASSLRAAA